MDVEEFLLEVGDGRVLQVRVAGPVDGVPLVAHHGTPSSGRPFPPYVEAATARGLRFVSYSRPGYALSTRAPGRTVADCVGDVERIIDHLGCDSFYTTGQSGGGPHALACAALLPERVIACATTAGVGPADADGLDFVAGMSPENVEETELARRGEAALLPYLERMAAMFRDVEPSRLAGELGGLVSDADVATLGGAFGLHAKAMLAESVSTGLFGWADDDAALLVEPWGFSLSEIRAPVIVWHGEEDRAVPVSHGAWIVAQVPGPTARILHGEGHLSLVVGRFPDVLDGLIGRVRPTPHPRGQDSS